MLEYYSMLKPHCKDALQIPSYALPGMETMGDRIRILRKAKNLEQEDLARLCDVSPQAVSMWERGATKNIKNEPLFKLLRALGTDLGYLIYGESRLPPSEMAKRAGGAR